MSTYVIMNVATNQTVQARGNSMGEVITRTCATLGWSVDQLRVTKKGGEK